MEQPQIFSLGQYEALQKTLQPHYSLTKGITNNLIVKTMHAAMAEIPLEMEYLPEDIRVRNHLSEYNFALKNMHFPEVRRTVSLQETVLCLMSFSFSCSACSCQRRIHRN